MVCDLIMSKSDNAKTDMFTSKSYISGSKFHSLYVVPSEFSKLEQHPS